ncbi:MAG: hypothetical protein ACRCX2_01220 [Paraclostridium sp.]
MIFENDIFNIELQKLKEKLHCEKYDYLYEEYSNDLKDDNDLEDDRREF